MDHRTLQLNSEYISKQQWSIRFRSVMGGKQVGLLLAVAVMLVVNFDCGYCNSQETVTVVSIRSKDVTGVDDSESVLHRDSRSVHRSRRTVFNSAEMQEALDNHNRVRRLVGASNMEIMTWNNDLAIKAENWAQQCVFEHDTTLKANNQGQNIRTTSATFVNVTQAVQEWYDETQYYTYDTSGCVVGQNLMCGHYTQLVWATSREVGCAYWNCTQVAKASIQGRALHIVCNYSPPGNVETQKPFLKGPGCSKCASGSWWCNEGLCDPTCTTSGPTCGCAPMCLNFATVNSATCSCSCAPGWYGSDCSVVCEDTDPKCTTTPSPNQEFYPTWYCTDSEKGPATRKSCPKLCNLCKGAGDSSHSTSTKPSFLNTLFVWLPWLLIYRFRSI